MKNRKLLLIVSLVLAMTLSLGSTLAYLTDTDADVNTMVLGNVQIVQNEQEWNASKTALKEYENDKPLLPYVGTLGWENTEFENGAYRRFTMNNVVDKYVTVTNQGNTDAYVRTIIALEMGDYAYKEFNMIGISVNAHNGSEFQFPGAWVWTEDFVADIHGHKYNIMVAEHQARLTPDETTVPSLLQVYLSKDADNKEVLALDGNDNKKYDILVISQAVQADGFGDAATALSAGFPYVTFDAEGNKLIDTELVAGWFENLVDENGNVADENLIGSPSNDGTNDKNETNNPPVTESAKVENVADLENALTKGVDIVLEADIPTDDLTIPDTDKPIVIDLNGKTVDAGYVENHGDVKLTNGTIESGTPEDYAVVSLADSVMTIDEVDIVSEGGGIGAVDGAKVVFNSGELAVNSESTSGRYLFYTEGEGSEVTINGGEFSFSKTLNQKRAYIYAGAGTTVYVNGGTFGKASTRSGYTAGILGTGNVVIKGGTFGFNPSAWVAEDCKVEKDGTNWVVSAK